MEEFSEVEVLRYGNGSAGFVYAHDVDAPSYSELASEYEVVLRVQGWVPVGLFPEAMLSVLTGKEVRRHETLR